MTAWLREIRFAARVLQRHRAATIVSIVTLTLAIGATTGIFTVVDATLLRALPFPDPDRIVQLARGFPNARGDATTVPKFVFWRDRSREIFSHVAAYETVGAGFTFLASGRPDRVVGARVSAEFLGAMGVTPAIGRDFRIDEDVPGRAKVVILSDDLWRHRFDARADVVGRAIDLNGEPYTVIGVAPAGFRFPDKAALWTLFQFDPASLSRANYFEVVGRLRPGVTLTQARAAMTIVGSEFARAHDDMVGPHESVAVVPLRDRLYGSMRAALLILLAAVGFVLLIACVNVANLQLAQAAERTPEIALRAALGAGTWTLVRPLLIESLLLAAIGGAAGIVLAYLSVPMLLALSPIDIAQVVTIGVDRRVLLTALALSLLCGLLFGLLPAWQAARTDLDRVLRTGAQRTTGGAGGAWTRRVLIAGEVALALMLTIGAFLLVKSLAGLRATDPGFSTEHVLTMKLALPEAKYGTPEALARFQEQLEGRVAGLPGVRAAALALSLPTELTIGMPFMLEGRYVPGTDTGVLGNALYRAVGAGYFPALQLPLRRGRLFDAHDRLGTLPVAIVNETAARQAWPHENPIGQRIIVGQPFVPELADPGPREIVGLVADAHEDGLHRRPPAMVYVPLAQQNAALTHGLIRLLPLALVIRGDGTATSAAANLTPAMQRAIEAIDPAQPVSEVRTMSEVVSRSLGSQMFDTVLLGSLALLALLLAAVGLYGVISHLVGQRTREIGVRMALGATQASVLALFVRQALALVAIGIVIGLAGAFSLTRFLASLLTGVGTTDRAVFVLAPAVLLAIACLAALMPALRAARIDPSHALRSE